MEAMMNALIEMLGSGWLSLLDYLAAHVLLCLVPAFIIAGYMSAMIPPASITRFLGPKAPRWISYPAAAAGGFLLAVCSCTILPLFAGIWKRGAGLGTAITFLFVGPAVNILAIAYTGAAIGMDIAIARIFLSIFFGIGIGMIMAWLFRGEERARVEAMQDAGMFDQRAEIRPAVVVVFLLLIAVLFVGTLQVDALAAELLKIEPAYQIPRGLQSWLAAGGLSIHGALLIVMLFVVGLAANRGLEHMTEDFSGWTAAALLLTAATVLLAALSLEPGSQMVVITGRFIGVAFLLTLIYVISRGSFSNHELREWIWETWKFVKQIFPLLIGGVFVAGMIKAVLPGEWVQSLAGRNTLFANLVGVLFGVFMYFPTLVEVPIARMFLDLGMHRGPLLAYLLADPELSVQSILVTGRLLGGKKTAAYVTLVTVFSTLAGYLFGLLLSAL
ncbi:MAG: permease [Anaerolineales bacterium]|nr:permease [Anaerolineales bacterium]